MADPVESLRQPVRLPVLARYIGQLAMIWSVLVAVPMTVAFATDEVTAGLCYAAIVALAGGGGFALSRVTAPRRIQQNEAMIIGCALFVISPLAMTVPLVSLGIPFLDAYFEAVSGVTTTGLSTLPSVEGRTSLFLFARSWTQWYGGLGIVALALALVTQPGALARRLSLTESVDEGIFGSARAQFRTTLTIYGGLTALSVLTLWLVGSSWFHSVTYALAAVSTGGFAPHDASLAGLGDYPLHVVVVVSCLACALPLGLYARAIRGRWRDVPTDPQLRTLLLAGALTALSISLTMHLSGGLSLSAAARHGPLMAFSAHTTAGFATVDVGTLDGASKLLMIFAMVVGGGAGSTAGGIKILRALVLFRVLHTMLAGLRLPKHAVLEARIAGRRIERTEIQEAVTVTVLFGATVLLSWLVFVASGYDPLDSLFEVVSATGTVGLSTGITNQELPAALKLLLCADMLLGRLELIALLVLLSPRTWMRVRRTA